MPTSLQRWSPLFPPRPSRLVAPSSAVHQWCYDGTITSKAFAIQWLPESGQSILCHQGINHRWICCWHYFCIWGVVVIILQYI